MDIKLTLFEVLLVIGIVQGLIMSGLMWFTKREKPGKLILSLVITVFNLLCIKIILLSSGLWQISWVRYLPLPLDLAIQPLLFLYIASLTSPGFKLNKKLLLHFIPFALSLGYSLFIYLSVLPFADLQKKDSLANHYLFNSIKEAEDFLSICSAIIYWYLGLKLILQYRKWLYDTTSNTVLPTYAWMKNVIILFGIFFLMVGINIVLDYGFDYGRTHFLHWQIVFVYLAVLIYYLGFKGYQIPGIPYVPSIEVAKEQPVQTKKRYAPLEIDKPQISVRDTVPDIAVPGENKRNSISGAILKMLSEEKLYLDPELNLQTVAGRLKMSPVAISRIINSELKKNFRNLVNEYRVEEVKSRLADPHSDQFSLLGIAYASGFNSEASFYRIFKNIVGVPPKEYLLKQQRQ